VRLGRMKILAVVPVRLEAARLPRKPLADLGGKPLVQWVYEAGRACKAFDEVVVATDADEIAECVAGFGGQAQLTSPDHRTGTDRVAEVAETYSDFDVVVNLQGDLPFAGEDVLAAAVEPYLAGESPPMTTVACPLDDRRLLQDPNVVKVVCDSGGNALYFSRSPIPHPAGGDHSSLHHLGIYAFTREGLLGFRSLQPTPLEQRERLEQLRALEHGMPIRVTRVTAAPLEVNTPEDLEAARRQVELPSRP
jgi:3-deoxy-manno-octulosonate cytidylyltransferase (CMP-KDO synthetase)